MHTQLEENLKKQLEKFESLVETPFNEELEEKMHFVKDGILNIEKYLAAKPKILFVLKEANSSDNSLTDMRECLKTLEGDNNNIAPNWGSTWNKIAYATYGIFENKLYQDMPLMNGNANEVLKHIPSIAQINLKKYAGGSRAKISELKHFYANYKDLFHEQIRLINPDVIIFCGSYSFINEEILEGDFGSKTEIKSEQYQHYYRTYKFGNKLIIDTYHPNASVTNEDYSNSIIKSVKELTNN